MLPFGFQVIDNVFINSKFTNKLISKDNAFISKTRNILLLSKIILPLRRFRD